MKNRPNSSGGADFFSALTALKRNWRWVLPLSLITAAVGVYSEVLAFPERPQAGSFSGNHLHVHWTPEQNDPNSWASAELFVQEDMELPRFIEQENLFKDQEGNDLLVSDVLSFNISSVNWSHGTVSRISAFSPIPDENLVLNKALTAGALKETSVEATVETFDGRSWRRSTMSPVTVAVFLENEHPIRHERQQSWRRNPLQERSLHWETRGRMAFNSKGEGQVSFPDGTSNTILIGEPAVPGGSWGTMGNLEAGRVSSFRGGWGEDWQTTSRLAPPPREVVE